MSAVTTTRDPHESSVFARDADRELTALVVHCPDRTEVGRVHATWPLCIGRERDGVTLVIADPVLSRRHATIAITRGAKRSEGSRSAGGSGGISPPEMIAIDGLHVADHASRNGTFVDGQRVEHAPLHRGSVVRMGETLFVIGRFAPHAEYRSHDPELIAYGPELTRVLDEIERCARSSAPVLILGETGTGKELLARRVHERSGRCGPFVALNCGAIVSTLAEATLFGHKRGAFTGAVTDADGCFARADGGTLFLDEVGELPLDLQPKLLRVLESGELTPIGGKGTRTVDARIVAATNANLEAEMVAGSFRPDLFARLKGFVLSAPPLRARRADIPLLLRHFLERERADARFEQTCNFLEALLLYPWPLNVRELKMTSHRLLAEVGEERVLRSRHLGILLGKKLAPKSSSTRPDAPPEAELRQALERCEGNVAHVAAFFGRHRKQVYRWLEKYDLDPASFRR